MGYPSPATEGGKKNPAEIKMYIFLFQSVFSFPPTGRNPLNHWSVKVSERKKKGFPIRNLTLEQKNEIRFNAYV